MTDNTVAQVVTEPLRALRAALVDRQALKQQIDEALPTITSRIDRMLFALGDKFPNEACEGGKWQPAANNQWTNSFWTGQLWLLWEMTGDARYREAAERHIHSFATRLVKRVETDTHDLGFLYSLSCVNAWRLTANLRAREIALHAAEMLMQRYHPTAGIVQAWGDLADPQQQGRMIIDCNMNLPLLYWASEQTGNPRFARAALSHATQAARYIVRPDASTYHTYYMDVTTGEPRYGDTHQGHSDDSCWARGQAWGIYGFMLSYRYSGQTDFVSLARRLSHYFINRLPEDFVCHWDLALVNTEAVRDSSAAAIAACGLLELAKALPATDADRLRYEEVALQIVQSLTARYLSTHHPACEGLLMHSVYHLPAGKGVDECCSWGDYFYLEALIRVRQCWTPYW